MKKVKLAEALLRRKELNEIIDRMRKIDNEDLFVVKTGRKAAHEGLDDIIAQVPKITYAEFQRAFHHYSKQLRLCDAAIQQANWTTEIEIGDDVMTDYEPKEAAQ